MGAIKFLEKIVAIIFIIASIVLISDSLFRVHSHDVDLDAFLYLGSRLNQGELIYFNDFETKLPFVQYLFYPAHLLGGIGAWRILTFIFCCILGLLGTFFLVEKNNPRYLHNNFSLKICSAGLFLLLLYDSPGATSAHLAVLSAGFFFLSSALITRICLCINPKDILKYTGIAGVSLAIATLIKQNYLFTLPAFFFVLIFSSCPQNLRIILKRLIIFCAGFTLIIIACFLPYTTSEKGFDILLSGISAIWHFPKSNQPIFPLEEFTDRATSSKSLFLYGTLLLTGVFLLVRVLSKKFVASRITKSYFVIFIFVALSLIGLRLSFISTHYLPHYYSMFVPFIVLISLIGYECLSTSGGILKSRFSLIEKIFIYLMIFLFVLMISNPIRSAIHRARFFIENTQEFNLKINERNIDPYLMQFLSSLHPTITWYILDSSVYHTTLSQPRIGDGHPEMLRYIANGIRIGPVNEIPLYSEKVFQKPCLALLNSGKDFIIFKKDNEKYSDFFTPACFTKKKSGYDEIQFKDVRTLRLNGFDYSNLSNYRIFINTNDKEN